MKNDLWDRVTDWLLVCLMVAAILLAICGIVLTIWCITTNGEENEISNRYYANSAVVMEIDRVNDTVICEDFNGFRWAFKGVEDWCVGDGVSLLMYDRGTPTVSDDEVKDAHYTAWVFTK